MNGYKKLGFDNHPLTKFKENTRHGQAACACSTISFIEMPMWLSS